MEFLSNAFWTIVSIIGALIALWCAVSCLCECGWGFCELWSELPEGTQNKTCGTLLGVMAIAAVAALAFLSQRLGWGL